MKRVTLDLIDKVREQGHEISIGGGATVDDIERLEKELGCPVPPTFRDFLLEFGSMAIYDNVIWGIHQGELLLLERTRTMQEEGEVPPHLVVVEPHEDGAYCFDFSRQRSDGEAPVVDFEFGSAQHDSPVSSTFEEFFQKFYLECWTEEAAE